jgi:hypothetical protein
MTKRFSKILLGMGLAAWSIAVSAGEVNGSKTNPKDDYSKGMSFCKFSGLNDDPTGINPEENGPPGRVQNYGHDKVVFPDDPKPGFGCNPNLNPLPPELLNR